MEPDSCSSKMPENLLRRMEQKIFNTKPDTQRLRVNVDLQSLHGRKKRNADQPAYPKGLEESFNLGNADSEGSDCVRCEGKMKNLNRNGNPGEEEGNHKKSSENGLFNYFRKLMKSEDCDENLKRSVNANELRYSNNSLQELTKFEDGIKGNVVLENHQDGVRGDQNKTSKNLEDSIKGIHNEISVYEDDKIKEQNEICRKLGPRKNQSEILGNHKNGTKGNQNEMLEKSEDVIRRNQNILEKFEDGIKSNQKKFENAISRNQNEILGKHEDHTRMNQNEDFEKRRNQNEILGKHEDYTRMNQNEDFEKRRNQNEILEDHYPRRNQNDIFVKPEDNTRRNQREIFAKLEGSMRMDQNRVNGDETSKTFKDSESLTKFEDGTDMNQAAKKGNVLFAKFNGTDKNQISVKGSSTNKNQINMNLTKFKDTNINQVGVKGISTNKNQINMDSAKFKDTNINQVSVKGSSTNKNQINMDSAKFKNTNINQVGVKDNEASTKFYDSNEMKTNFIDIKKREKILITLEAGVKSNQILTKFDDELKGDQGISKLAARNFQNKNLNRETIRHNERISQHDIRNPRALTEEHNSESDLEKCHDVRNFETVSYDCKQRNGNESQHRFKEVRDIENRQKVINPEDNKKQMKQEVIFMSGKEKLCRDENSAFFVKDDFLNQHLVSPIGGYDCRDKKSALFGEDFLENSSQRLVTSIESHDSKTLLKSIDKKMGSQQLKSTDHGILLKAKEQRILLKATEQEILLKSTEQGILLKSTEQGILLKSTEQGILPKSTNQGIGSADERKLLENRKEQYSSENAGLERHRKKELNVQIASTDLRNKTSIKTPKTARYSSLNSPKQFPKELIQQLSQHERFNLKSEKSLELVNLGNPDFGFRESNVQFEENPSKFGCKRSNSVPPLKNPRKLKNPRNADLFNPSYAFERVNNQLTSMGRGLLESIRTRVFGFQQNEKLRDDDNEWSYDPNIPFPVSKLPKETRYATASSSLKNPRICESCSRSLRGVKLVDTQTSPINSRTDFRSRKKIIPCPVNILCDRGIHLGKCAEGVREKTDRRGVCASGCGCKSRRDFDYTGIKVYPGRAEKPFGFKVSSGESSSGVLTGSSSEVSIGVEAKSSMETILKLMEPEVKSAEASSSATIQQGTSKTVDKNMNGMNGHANGDLNGCGDIITQNQQKGCWTIGLINSKFRYLTAETFGFKINANGASLKKKQIWTLEPESSNNGDSLIYLRSHLDKYLAVDSFGNVTCESEEKEPGCQFQISVSEDGSGRWALKNVVRGYFLGSTSDKLTCTAKVPGDAEFWHIHLAARPQVNLRSVGRKRFAHLSENLDEIHVDANIPWGEDTLFTLEFRLEESGKYAIHTCNNKYLSMGGKLVDACNKDCLFSAEYHSGQLALRDRTGAYLSPIGSKAVLKTRSNTVTKDELFSLEDSLPQASFVASLNSRFVSVKQGVDVTANQDEISDHETFQLEFDWSTKRWYIRTMQDRYWTLETGGGIQASGDKRSSNALFDLVWQGDGSLAFRANNGRYVITKRSGHLYATADTIDDNCKYFFYLINRPILVLKCEQGFVGYKAAGNPKLECNKATYECIQVERGEKGVVFFKGQSGKYWHADSEGVNADSDTQEGFYLELREPTRLCIKSLNGNYLTASKNGLFRLGDTNIENATQWEY